MDTASSRWLDLRVDSVNNSLARWIRSRVGDSAQEKSQIHVGLRLLEGKEPRLWRRWTKHGIATLRPGRMEFRHAAGGIRFFLRAPFTLEVSSVDVGSLRKPEFCESVGEEIRVVDMRTPTARIALVVDPNRLAWAVGILLPSQAG